MKKKLWNTWINALFCFLFDREFIPEKSVLHARFRYADSPCSCLPVLHCCVFVRAYELQTFFVVHTIWWNGRSSVGWWWRWWRKSFLHLSVFYFLLLLIKIAGNLREFDKSYWSRAFMTVSTLTGVVCRRFFFHVSPYFTSYFRFYNSNAHRTKMILSSHGNFEENNNTTRKRVIENWNYKD